MKMDPQFISAPDGSWLVIITEAEYRQLLDARDDADDLAAAFRGRDSIAEEGTIPAEVSRAIRAGKHPIAAWRECREISQAALAERIGVTQAAIARLERAPVGSGKPETRRKIAAALDAPAWSINGTVAADGDLREIATGMFADGRAATELGRRRMPRETV